jgi:hypothetical protein
MPFERTAKTCALSHGANEAVRKGLMHFLDVSQKVASSARSKESKVITTGKAGGLNL